MAPQPPRRHSISETFLINLHVYRHDLQVGLLPELANDFIAERHRLVVLVRDVSKELKHCILGSALLGEQPYSISVRRRLDVVNKDMHNYQPC